MKTFNELILEKKENIEVEFTGYGDFDSVNQIAEDAANIVAKQNYKILLEDMVRNNPEVVDWNFLDSDGKPSKNPNSWRRMNPTGKTYYGGSYNTNYGISLTLKMKFPIKKKIENLEAVVGDVPEYTLVVDMDFNTTGNKARTSIRTEGRKLIMTTSDTIGFTKIVEKIRKMKPDEIANIHKELYEEWIKTQKDHPMRGTVAGKKYGV
jgi:hypothetical protein